MKPRSRFLAASALALITSAAVVGCLDPVSLGSPDPQTQPDAGGGDADPGIPAKHTGHIDKVDLLFVIDNSISMADKQLELARRVPEMIRELLSPSPDPATGKPRHEPVRDLHVAFVTSSLGTFGASACAPVMTNPSNDDQSHLLPRPGETFTTGFRADLAGPQAATCPAPKPGASLTWVADPTRDPSADYAGAEGIDGLAVAASCVVQSAQQSGCGYEQPLEAMYRFLIDPAPYATAEASCSFGISGDVCTGEIARTGVDETVLAQRAAFLRPDSVVAVVVLSDENDFSLRPTEGAILPLAKGKGQMPRAHAACANVPDDVEGLSAEELRTKYGCTSCATDPSDPACSTPWPGEPTNRDVDGRNTRMFQTIQRYGREFLWPTSRYVDGFTNAKVPGSDGVLAPNPLFASGKRALDMVVFAGIVGVPRPLVENADETPKKLSAADWDEIVSADLSKRDPHMIESIAPRAGLPKFAGDRAIDPVHGGDRDIPDGDDLQYACIAGRAVTTNGQNCMDPSSETLDPLCDGRDVQPYFKAYPGLRVLRTVRALGDRGHAASICAPSYAPIVAGLADKIHETCGDD